MFSILPFCVGACASSHALGQASLNYTNQLLIVPLVHLARPRVLL